MSRRMRQFIFLAAVLWALPAVGQTQSASDSATAHRQLQQVLNRPMFQAWRMRQEGKLPEVDVNVPRRLRDLMGRMVDSIKRFIRWLFNRNSPTITRGTGASEFLPTFLKVLAWTVLCLAILFFAILVVRIMGQRQETANLARVLSRRQVHEALETGDALAMGASQWIDEAQRLAEAQNFRAMYRALYLALLSGLHTAGKIEHSRNHTNWTYVQRYHGPAQERDLFAELTDLFDHVWYGRQKSEGGDLEQLRQKVVMLTGAGAKA